jgi:hypothetical protein
MSILAWRNLVDDKVRLGVTLTGIVFAVVLIVVEFGLFLGFTSTTSGLIDRSGADLWVIAKRVPYIELSLPFTDRKLSTVRATPGVAEAEKYVARFTEWQRPDGRRENVQIVGKKTIRTDEPAERVDTKILEVLLELDKGQQLPLGLRVDAFILANDAISSTSAAEIVR